MDHDIEVWLLLLCSIFHLYFKKHKEEVNRANHAQK